jgi:hypothetical protein
MIGRFLCWLGYHRPPRRNPHGHGIWVCSRRRCGQLETGDWP